MNTSLIAKSVLIEATAEKVWNVLTQDELNRQWLAAFGAGNIAVTDWQQGSKVLFMDGEASGLVGILTVVRPFEEILITYTGIVGEGKEDYESEMAKMMAGFEERYVLEAEGDSVKLSISCMMGDEWFDEMSAAWDRALEKVKALSS